MAFRSVPQMTSSVPSRPPGSCWSTATFVVQTCGKRKSSVIAFRSKDCCRIELSCVTWSSGTSSSEMPGKRFGLAPGFEITLPTHTKGTRPEKMPVPPRSCVERSPKTSQLNPKRGDHSGLAPGRSLWSTVVGSSSSSIVVRPRENGLSTGSVK